MARWNIEGSISISRPPEEVFEAVTDFKNATIVPGIKKAKLASGEERQEGTIYACQFGLDGIGRGTIAIRVKEMKPPHSAEVELNQATLPLKGVIFKVGGMARWEISEMEGGCRAVLITRGEIGGLAGHLPGVQRVVEMQMEKAVRGTLANLKNKNGLENSS